MFEYILLFIGSLIANTLSAFAGGGAGLVQLPLIILMGLPFAEALATHKTATVALGLGSIVRNISNRDMSWKFAAYAMLCGVTGTIVGAFIILHVPEKAAQLTLGILTTALGTYSFFKKDIGQISRPRNRNLLGYAVGGIVLFTLGIFNGSLSSGSGLFVTIWFIVWFGMDYKMAVVYTMTLVGFFWNLTGAVSLYMFGEDVKLDWLPVLWVASFTGGWLGAHLGHLKGNQWIKRGFVFVTLVSGLTLILK